MERKDKKRKKRILTGIAILILLLSALPAFGKLYEKITVAAALSPMIAQDAEYPLNIYFLDVGKADAIVIACDGAYALVDAGTFAGGSDVIVALKKLGVEELEYVFATHPDSDHIGGLGQVLSTFSVNRLIVADTPEELLPGSTEYILMEEAVKKKGIVKETAFPGFTYTLGSAEFAVLGPVGEHADINNYSLVMKLSLGGFSCLLMGDAEERQEEMLCDLGVDLSADVLKVGHHGSKSSTSQILLEAVQPGYAVISTGKDNNNLPKKSVLKRLQAAGAELFRTDTDGTVLVSSDGAEIAIKTER